MSSIYHSNSERQQYQQQPLLQQQPEMIKPPARTFTVVAIGKSGEGKSTLLNAILGQEIFPSKASVQEVTQKVGLASNYFLNVPTNPVINCIDTPSFNGQLHNPDRIKEINTLLESVANGVDAFLFVVKCTHYRYDNTFHQTLQTYQALFTPAFWSKVIIVFTHVTPELVSSSQGSRLLLLAWAREIQESFKLESPPMTVFAMDYGRFPYPAGGAESFWDVLMTLDANTDPYKHRPFLESLCNGISVDGYVQRIKGHLALFEPSFFEEQAEGQYSENKKKREKRFSFFRKRDRTSVPPALPATATVLEGGADRGYGNTLEFTPLAVSTRLPAECLQLIIAHYDGDLTMLHSLLLVNTTCFHLAVRLLYRSPFKLLRSYDGDKLPWNKYVRQVKLVWLLLSCVLHNQWVMDELPPIDQSFPVLRNPMRHGGSTSVDVAVQDGRKKDGIDLTTTTNTIRDLTVDYLRFYTHHDHATLSDAFPELFPGVACSLMDEWAQSKDRAQLRQTIERAFLLHQPENIISLSIPISRMKIYLEAVPRLPKLECVEFYDIRNWDTGNVEEAITFVREHDRFAIQSQQKFQKDVGTFGQSSTAAAAAAATADTATATSRNVHADPEKMAKLIEIKLGGSGDSGIIQTTELYKILQAMRHPKVVDLTEWKGAVMDIMQIPVKTLQILRMRLDRPLPITCPLGSFLLQARSLRELQISIAPTHGRLFRWAVKKMQQRNKQQTKVAKKGFEGNHGGTQQQQQTTRHLSDNQQGKSQHSTSNVMEEGLQVLSLAGETATVVQALNAAVWGFNNTLEILQANTWKENSGLQFEDVAGVVPQADEAVVLDMDDEDDNNIQSGENTDEGNSDDSTGNENAVAGPISSSLCFNIVHT
ncbi:hypothetical protein BGZ49_010373 [Haplosporangium sp. Z 27]|nr:hypothetical protein BGZ49_010373 [Haplosporangium sp. Z 27]